MGSFSMLQLEPSLIASGPVTTVILALIREMPAIITAMGALVGAVAATFAALQSRRNGRVNDRVETQTNGHLTRLYTENVELQKMVTTLVALMPRPRPSRVTDPQIPTDPSVQTDEAIAAAEKLLAKVRVEDPEGTK